MWVIVCEILYQQTAYSNLLESLVMHIEPEPQQPYGSWQVFDVTVPRKEHLLGDTRAMLLHRLHTLCLLG